MGSTNEERRGAPLLWIDARRKLPPTSILMATSRRRVGRGVTTRRWCPSRKKERSLIDDRSWGELCERAVRLYGED